MKIVVSGSRGLIGSALVASLSARGDTVVRLARGVTSGAGEVSWAPDAGTLDLGGLEALDAVVHLAGENIAARRWTTAQKARIRDSRVQGTRLLAEGVARLECRPAVFVSASAIGYYGDRGDAILREDSGPGTGFLAEVCQAWESATEPVARAGIRTVPMRIGVVLSAAGGALAKMLLPFRLGLGGRIGTGRQFMSWIAIDDLVGVIEHILDDGGLQGPINAVSPNSVTNLEFTKTLGRVLSRPTIFPMPAFAARLAFGEMAQELLLSSTRVEPARLAELGFTFKYPELETALQHVLGISRT